MDSPQGVLELAPLAEISMAKHAIAGKMNSTDVLANVGIREAVMRSWTYFLIVISFCLTACGGGGGSPGTPGPTPNPPPPPAATTGTLAVTASGLPTGANASVRVNGPSNFQQDLTGSQTLS